LPQRLKEALTWKELSMNGAVLRSAALRAVVLVAIGVAAAGPAAHLAAQTPEGAVVYPPKRVPPAEGFRVYIVPDMEGMGSTVSAREVIAGNEGERYRDASGPDYWSHFRSLLTQEVNAVIAGARRAGATSFVVNEGHGGNLFANVLPWELDPEAILIRGWPKPQVMSTGLDESFGTAMFTGAHANAGSPGVMAHSYSFDEFTVNGVKLNEVGINALVAGEMGVSVSLISGDDVLVAETKEMLHNGVIGVVDKIALSRSAAITYSPAKVREMLEEAAYEAVTREMAGDFAPLTMERPYRVDFTMRRSYPETFVRGVEALDGFDLEKTGERSFRYTAPDAKRLADLLNEIEKVVLR